MNWQLFSVALVLGINGNQFFEVDSGAKEDTCFAGVIEKLETTLSLDDCYSKSSLYNTPLPRICKSNCLEKTVQAANLINAACPESTKPIFKNWSNLKAAQAVCNTSTTKQPCLQHLTSKVVQLENDDADHTPLDKKKFCTPCVKSLVIMFHNQTDTLPTNYLSRLVQPKVIFPRLYELCFK